MIYWSGLYAELDRDQLVEGANTMLRVAKEILVAQTTRQVNQLLLKTLLKFHMLRADKYWG
jgi:hypothetical protein